VLKDGELLVSLPVLSAGGTSVADDDAVPLLLVLLAVGRLCMRSVVSSTADSCSAVKAVSRMCQQLGNIQAGYQASDRHIAITTT